MFPKWSLDARNIATLREHSANIPGILRASWEVSRIFNVMQTMRHPLRLNLVVSELSKSLNISTEN